MLRALYTAKEPGAILEPSWAWRRQQYAEPENWGMGDRGWGMEVRR
jgi:hypothetical protein